MNNLSRRLPFNPSQMLIGVSAFQVLIQMSRDSFGYLATCDPEKMSKQKYEAYLCFDQYRKAQSAILRETDKRQKGKVLDLICQLVDELEDSQDKIYDLFYERCKGKVSEEDIVFSARYLTTMFFLAVAEGTFIKLFNGKSKICDKIEKSIDRYCGARECDGIENVDYDLDDKDIDKFIKQLFNLIKTLWEQDSM